MRGVSGRAEVGASGRAARTATSARTTHPRRPRRRPTRTPTRPPVAGLSTPPLGSSRSARSAALVDEQAPRDFADWKPQKRRCSRGGSGASVREDRRRCVHRLPGGGGGARRHLAAACVARGPRAHVGGPFHGCVLRGARFVRPGDPARSSRDGALEPERAASQPGDARGGSAGGARRGRLRPDGPAGGVRGRSAERAIRERVSGANALAHLVGSVGAAGVGPRLPVGIDSRSGRARDARGARTLGHEGLRPQLGREQRDPPGRR